MDCRCVFLCIAVVTIILPVPVETGNILVLVFPTWSHIKPKLNIATSLANKYEHHSTFILSEEFANKVKEDNITSVIVPAAYKNVSVDGFLKDSIDDACNRKMPPFFTILTNANRLCHALLSDEDLFTVLQQQNFDLAFIDNVMIADCFTVLAYKLGIPYVQLGVMHTPVRTRIPFMPSVHPAFALLGFFDEMSFIQRVVNTLFSVVMAVSPQVIFPTDLVATYVPEKPFVPLEVLHRRTAFHLVDMDFVLDFPRPLMPNVAFVGGVGTEKPKPLPSDLNSYMASATNGVIVASFGSIANSLPASRMETLIGVFKKFKNVKFVLRYGNETKEDGNILLMPWLPQNDLLGHPNTKAFITHCGIGGLYEGLYNAVPMIGLPFMTDGFYNCRKMAFKGFGISYDFCIFTDLELSNAIQEILDNPKYSVKIKKASDIFHGQQGTPSERSAYWIDHVIQHGGDYLQTPATDMPLYKYYLLDVLLFITLVTFLIIWCCVRSIRACCRCCCRPKIKVD
ncbi:UDP-glucuronosyltransferase 1-6-like [Mizuhopecten yessoensis]|uniref:UDP-glucuronosyltransferase 1-2 n=1 Tax=Mizuhopecten yessoensis TaxID=6573 RepID=A0A210QD50_MIZYE|nr:UDP-glucuronosyltransferase 1-6-like [Mizuhopecten yessoensis]OWF46693.1 UDP-glucuronosyltransferase 1-2 [Mizuhopecten yessoensis]